MAKSLSMVGFLFVALPSCGTDSTDNLEAFDCANEAFGEEYFAGIEKTGASGYRFQLVDALPAPPDRGENDWTLELADSAGAPVEKVTLEVVPWMPIHKHGSPVVPTIDENDDGSLSISRIDLIMPGPWEITIRAEQDGKELDEVVFKFCARG